MLPGDGAARFTLLNGLGGCPLLDIGNVGSSNPAYLGLAGDAWWDDVRAGYGDVPAPAACWPAESTPSPYTHRLLVKAARDMAGIYDMTVRDIHGKSVGLDRYKGKVLLIVNTASKCGFTPQYEGLEALYSKHHVQGLEVLGFPCNQFGAQEPGTESEIASFCELNYHVTFPMFAKVDVNGDGAAPLWKWLKKEKPGLLGSEGIKWNFTKFLVDRQGKVIARYAPTDKPESIAADIEKLL